MNLCVCFTASNFKIFKKKCKWIFHIFRVHFCTVFAYCTTIPFSLLFLSFLFLFIFHCFSFSSHCLICMDCFSFLFLGPVLRSWSHTWFRAHASSLCLLQRFEGRAYMKHYVINVSLCIPRSNFHSFQMTVSKLFSSDADDHWKALLFF